MKKVDTTAYRINTQIRESTTERCRFWLGKGPCPKCGLLSLEAVTEEETDVVE